MDNKVILQTDGGARGNPGPSAVAAVFYNDDLEILNSYSEFIGNATNNTAEYKALILGIESALKNSYSNLDIRMDSELIVKQIKGEYKVKDENLKLLHAKARELLSKVEYYTISHVRREQNKEADRLVNVCLDKISADGKS